MRLLLDSHAVVWWFAGDSRFRAHLRPIVTDAANLVFVSAASAWEIATKVSPRWLLGGVWCSAWRR